MTSAARCVPGQEPGQVKAAFLAEPDVDQDEVGPQRAGLPQRLGDARGHAHDRQALALQQQAGRLQEGVIIIY